MKNLAHAMTRIYPAEMGGPASDERDETILVSAGQPADSVVWVEEGAVEILRGPKAGEGWVCHVARAPCVLGLAELLDGTPAFLESARALGPVRVRKLRRAPLRAVVLSEPAVTQEMMVALADRLLTSALAGMLPGTEAETRLAWLFTQYGRAAGKKEGHAVRLPLRRTQAQLAKAIAGSERSVNRVITRWKSERLLDKIFGEHVLYQPDELAHRANYRPEANVRREALVAAG